MKFCFHHQSYPQLDVIFFWLHPFILSEVISPLISSSILGTYWSGEFISQCPIFSCFHTVHGVLEARILKWFAIPFSSEWHSIRPLHHDSSVLGGPTWHGLHWVRQCWSWMVRWRPKDLLELTPKKDVLFIIGDWNAKVVSQETPGITGKLGLGVQNEAWQRLTEFCQENTLVIANTFFQQHRRRLYTWTSPDGQHQNQTDYIPCSKDGEALYCQQKQDKFNKNKFTRFLEFRSWMWLRS